MKKSDFAQKLLDDLRLRKQRLAAANASAAAADVSGSTFQRATHGSQVQPTHELNGRRSRHHARPGDSSKEIVPLHAGHASESISDLSMALAFALENSGRLATRFHLSNSPEQKSVLPHRRLRSIDIGETGIRYLPGAGRSPPSGFPYLSQLHIQEISRGAQKLNQMLKACSAGAKFDRRLIDVAKELLKGATGLEESLRLLGNIQGPSEHRVAPARNKIQLLEGGEDEEEDYGAKNQLSLRKPRYSFDGSSRNFVGEVARTGDLKQKLQLISHLENFDSRQQNTQRRSPQNSRLSSHRRSASLDLDSRAIVTLPDINKLDLDSTHLQPKSKTTIKQPSSLSSGRDKGRIPNVIAKLMGLEELPLEGDPKGNGSKKGPGSESKTRMNVISMKKEQRSTKDQMDLMKLNREKPLSLINQHMEVLSGNNSPKIVVSEMKQTKKPLKSQKQTSEINEKVNMVHVDHMKENRASKQEEQGRAETVIRRKEQDAAKDGHDNQAIYMIQKPILAFEMQKKLSQGRPEAAVVETSKRSPSLKEQMTEKERVQSRKDNQDKPLHDDVIKLQTSAQNSESEHRAERLGAAETELSSKIILGEKDAERTEMEMKNQLRTIHQNNSERRPAQRMSITAVSARKNSAGSLKMMQGKGPPPTLPGSNLKELVNGRSEAQITTTDFKARVEKPASNRPPIVILKPPRSPFSKKMDDRRAAVKKIAEVPLEEERDPELGSLKEIGNYLKQQVPVLQEVKKSEMVNEVKEAASLEHEISHQDRYQETELSSHSLNSAEDDVMKPMMEKILNEKANDNSMTPALKLPEVSFNELKELKSDLKNIPEGLTEKERTEKCSSLMLKQRSAYKPVMKDRLLDVHENQLKQILVKSQHFLNAAEAFFNLEVPADVFQASYSVHPDKENKILIDCTYELMKRKYIRGDSASYPPAKKSIASLRTNSLDALISELNKDLGHLKSHEKADETDCSSVHSLNRMLERDIQCSNLDANCMWDFGWSSFAVSHLDADEVVKDVEKSVLNRLIDEIARELLNSCIANYCASGL